MNFMTDGNPEKSAVYLIDRDKQGKWYRYFNAETGEWSRPAASLKEAVETKDSKSVVGFFPWVGPLTGPNYQAKREVVVDVPVAEIKAKAKPVKPVAPVKAVKPVKPVKTKNSAKQTYADGTVFFRTDRNKWVAVWNGKQEAARPTKEAALAFLKKKYNFDGVVIE